MNPIIITTLIERVFGWPVAVLILGIIFRREMAAFWQRIENLTFKHGETSVEARIGSASGQTAASVKVSDTINGGLIVTNTVEAAPVAVLPAEIAKAKRDAIDFGKNIPAVESREPMIRQHLADLNFDMESAETVDVLIRNLAFNQWIAFSERNYRLIFGSQITLLNQLHIGAVNTLHDCRRIYEKALTEFPKFYEGYSFESWVGFLQLHNLVRWVDETERVEITQAGREFLLWITVEGVNTAKLG